MALEAERRCRRRGSLLFTRPSRHRFAARLNSGVSLHGRVPLTRVYAVSLLAALGAAGCASNPIDLAPAIAQCERLASEPLQPSTVTFQNRLSKPVSIYWASSTMDAPMHYEDVAPGKSHVQNTYVGHFGVAKDPSGKVMSTYCSSAPAGTLELGGGQSPAG